MTVSIFPSVFAASPSAPMTQHARLTPIMTKSPKRRRGTSQLHDLLTRAVKIIDPRLEVAGFEMEGRRWLHVTMREEGDAPAIDARDAADVVNHRIEQMNGGASNK
jgi:hypothetical protein